MYIGRHDAHETAQLKDVPPVPPKQLDCRILSGEANGRYSCIRSLMSEDFPEPFGPRIAGMLPLQDFQRKVVQHRLAPARSFEYGSVTNAESGVGRLYSYGPFLCAVPTRMTNEVDTRLDHKEGQCKTPCVPDLPQGHCGA